MRIKNFVTMMLAATALVLGVCSCGSDDDEPEVPVATQVAGSYDGNEIIMVMGEESSNETKTYQISEASDAAVDLTVPASGMGMMTIPSFTVKNIPLSKNGNTITGKLDSFAGTVKNAQGDEKAFTVSNVTMLFSDKTVVATFSLKYGNMPMAMDTNFTGRLKN